MDAQENLQLSVANFGPIAKAEIDLRPLTVLPIAWQDYCLHEHS